VIMRTAEYPLGESTITHHDVADVVEPPA